MFYLPDKEKKKKEENKKEREWIERWGRGEKKLPNRNFTNKKSPENNNLNMTQLKYDTN